MSRKRISRDNSYWIANHNENLRKLEAHVNEPYEVLGPMFGGRSPKTLRDVIYRYKIGRDRDKAPNATKGPKKWTPERVEELRQDRNLPKPELKKKYACSWRNLEKVLSMNGITRDRPEKIVWTDETDKILVTAAIASRQHSPYDPEGREKLRELKSQIVTQLKQAGFKGHTGDNSIYLHLRTISQERLGALGFTEVQTPLGWGSKVNSPRSKATEKNISARITELILRGILKEKGGIEAFRQQILQEFAEEIRRHELDFNEGKFKRLVDKLVWTEVLDTQLEQLLMSRKDPVTPTFLTHYPFIPEEMIKAREKYKKGITSILHPSPLTVQHQETLRGVGRLFTDEEMTEYQKFDLPRHGFKNPYKVKAPQNWKFMAPNGINFGIEFNPVMEKNPTRRIFAQAERDGCQVIVTSGLIEFETAKASGIVKALRALVSGRNIGINLLDPSYRENARRILTILPADEVMCVTTREGFDDLMTGLWDVTHKPDPDDPEKKKVIPEFNGQVLVILGPKEEEIAVAAAAAAVVKNILTKLNRIRAEIGLANTAFRPYAKQLRVLEKERHELEEQDSGRASEAEKAKLEQQMSSLTEKINQLAEDYIKPQQQKIEDLIDQEARERVNNVDPKEWKRYIRAAIAYVVKRIEQAIPNCQVIGRGTTYIQVGDKIGECYIPGHLQVTRNLAADYTRSYGGRVRRKQMADFAIIFHPYSFYYDVNTRRVDYGGRVERDVPVIVAPTGIDGAYLRPLYSHIVRKVHPIAKLVSSELFSPGVLEVTCQNGIITPGAYSMESLGYYEKVEKAAPAHLKILKKLDGKRINILQNSDEHVGGGSKEFVECRKCRLRMGVGEAFYHLLRHAGYGSPAEGKKIVPIHMVVMSDDGVQGDPRSFFKHRQPHRHQLSREQKEKFLWEELGRKIVTAGNEEEREKILQIMKRTDMYQMEIRGEHWVENQIREMKKMLGRNADMLDSILQRFVQSGLRLKPVSEHINQPHIRYDSCDAGVIDLYNGNHLLHSVEGQLMEGSIYADHLIGCLMEFPHWRGKKHILEKYIKAPNYENIYLGLATIQAPGLRGLETMYGLELRGNVPAGPHWFDLLQKQATNDLGRGNLSQIFELLYVLWFCGNSHFLAQIMTERNLYTMGAPGTHTDSFAERARGLPPNVSGVNIVSVPAGGHNDGPLVLKPLMYSDLRYFLEESNPEDFDVEAFLPDPF